jgi:hypothetical protein
MPQAYSRTVPPPMNEATLGETPLASSASSQSPKRRQPRIRSSHCSPTTSVDGTGSPTSPPNGAGE